MICNEYKFLFVHIPKTAGQSIELLFLEKLGLSWKKRSRLLLRANPDPTKGPPRLAHLTAEEYLKYNYLKPDIFNSYYKFSFVRNPWARLFSEYKFRYADTCDFKTFVFKKFPQPKNDYYDRGLDLYRHILPQYDFIFDKHGNKLVDFVGKFENLQSDFNLICQQLNISPEMLPHKNKSKKRKNSYKKAIERLTKRFKPDLNHDNSAYSVFKKHYSEYYDDETKEFVANLYHKDRVEFDYQFGN